MTETIEQIVAQVAEGNDFLRDVHPDAIMDFVRQVIDKAEWGKGEPVAFVHARQHSDDLVVTIVNRQACEDGMLLYQHPAPAPEGPTVVELDPDREWVDVEVGIEILRFYPQAPAPEVERAIPEGEPVGYANRDELDNMLSDRTATIAGVRDGWRNTALYTHAPEVQHDALRYRWLRPHLFCGSDYLAKIETSRDCCVSNPEGHHLEGAKIDAAIDDALPAPPTEQ